MMIPDVHIDKVRILCKFILGVPVFLCPVFIEVLGNPADNPVATSFISENPAYRLGAAAHLPDTSLQDVGSTYGFHILSGKS